MSGRIAGIPINQASGIKTGTLPISAMYTSISDRIWLFSSNTCSPANAFWGSIPSSCSSAFYWWCQPSTHCFFFHLQAFHNFSVLNAFWTGAVVINRYLSGFRTHCNIPWQFIAPAHLGLAVLKPMQLRPSAIHRMQQSCLPVSKQSLYKSCETLESR